MHYTQNQKLEQVTEKTLVIGVDIGSEDHHARAFNYRGIEYSPKDFRFSNDAKGFEAFQGWMQSYVQMFGKEKVIVGFEPTGHYWYRFADFLKALEIMYVMVAPQHVKHSKEMDDNTQRKDDHKDPKVIAKLVTDGRYIIPYVPEGIYAELRTAYSRYCELTETKVRLENRITRWFDIYFPEYREVYKNPGAKTGMMVLRIAPLPADVVKLGADGINQLWRNAKARAAGMKRAETLVAAAARSTGRVGGDAVRRDLWQMLEEYELVMRHLDQMQAMLEELVAQIDGAERLLRIKGVGFITVAGFFAEVGDLSRFTDPKQIQKLAGLAVVTPDSSGKHNGQSEISRRGRKRLRMILFRAAMSMVKSNREIKTLHEFYTTREQNPLKKMQSLMAIAGKIIRVFYGIMRNGTEYDPVRLLADIRRPGTDKNVA
jgi:transposase